MNNEKSEVEMVISQLADLQLEGKLQGVAIVGLLPEDNLYMAWTSDLMDQNMRSYGAIQFLAQHFLKDMSQYMYDRELDEEKGTIQ